MQAVFMLEGLWEIGNGPLPNPLLFSSKRSSEEDKKQDGPGVVQRDLDSSAEWITQDNRALAMLKLLLDNSQLVLVLGCRS